MKKTKKISGMFWHCHHDELYEYCWDKQERINYIKFEKPKSEIKTRLKLFKKIKGKLPKELLEATQLREATKREYEKTNRSFMSVRYNNWIYEVFSDANKNLEKIKKEYSKLMNTLHKKECGCKEWSNKYKMVRF
jgi:hypothetical protein